MADHPLKPATDRRLGRPLPSQLANQLQTHPWAPEFSRIPSQVRSYGVLAIVSNCCPPLKGRFSTFYSPVRHFPLTEVRFSFDLHVWSTPPAFVLSQDQTLHCQKVYVHRLPGANQIICSTSFFIYASFRFRFVVFFVNHFFSKLTSIVVCHIFSIFPPFRFQLFCFQCSFLVSNATQFLSIVRYRGFSYLAFHKVPLSYHLIFYCQAIW